MSRGIMAMCVLASLAACQDKPTDPVRQEIPAEVAGKLVISAGLSPHPSAVDLSRVGAWNSTSFRVNLSHPILFDRLKLVANPGYERLIELGTARPGAYTRSFCPAEGHDTVIREPGQNVYIQVCGSGEATIVIKTINNVAIDTLSFEVGEPPLVEAPVDTSFDIELVFMDNGVFDAREENWIRTAAERWERVISKGVDDFSYVGRPRTIETRWGASVTLNDVIDDIRIYVGVVDRPDLRTIAWGGGGRYRSDTYKPIVSFVTFNEAQFDYLDRNNRWYGTALHEIGHCLGFSDFYWAPERQDLLRLPSLDNLGADAHFIGPQAVAAFDRAGGESYRGNKVPLENRASNRNGRDNHWRQSVFQNEVMDPYASIGEYFSEITIAAFEDMGYEVDYAPADRYRLPRRAAKPAVEPMPHGWCEVIEPVAED